MPTPKLISKSRLHGVRIFLSASVPQPERATEYERIPEAPLRIEEAIISVARAVFMEGGTLVFGGHPSVSPLIARVVKDYYLPKPAEALPRRAMTGEGERWLNPSLSIYQSRVWEEWWAESTRWLEMNPLVQVHWTPAADGERIDPRVVDRPQAPQSTERMRREMIAETAPAAMIAIGGMKGLLDEARIFRQRWTKRPIFALGTTGGAAAILAKSQRGESRVEVPDARAAGWVKQFWADQNEQTLTARFGAQDSERNFYVPYALVAQQIVARMTEAYG